MSKRGFARPMIVLITCLSLTLLGTVVPATGPDKDRPKPERLEDVDFLNCTGCHKESTGLPSGHLRPESPATPDCRECHRVEKTLRGRIPLAHLHRMSGLDCYDCHDSSGSPRALEGDECLNCHGPYQNLIDKTKRLDPNPHNSHYQAALGCDACHHAHSPGENFCSQCHDWSLKVP